MLDFLYLEPPQAVLKKGPAESSDYFRRTLLCTQPLVR